MAANSEIFRVADYEFDHPISQNKVANSMRLTADCQIYIFDHGRVLQSLCKSVVFEIQRDKKKLHVGGHNESGMLLDEHVNEFVNIYSR